MTNFTNYIQPLTNERTKQVLFYPCQHRSFCNYYNRHEFMNHIFSRRIGSGLYCDLCSFTSSGIKIHKEEMHSSLPKTNVEVEPKIQLKIPEKTVAAKTPGAETAPVSTQISDFSALKARSGYQCAYCMKRFGKKAKFERHIQIHTQEGPFKCDNCSLSFNCQSHWKRHTFKLKRGPVQKCFYCEMTFCFQNTLRKHLKDLHADAPSEAPALPSFFKSGEEDEGSMLEDPRENRLCVQDLQLEILEKTQEVCHFCKKVFGGSNKKSLLEEHIRIHTVEEPFKCCQCSYNCAEQSDLDHHERRHLASSPEDSCSGNGNVREKYDDGKSVKPFKCKYCNYKSGRLSAIRYHERSHTAPKKKINFLGETTSNPGRTKINSGEDTNNSVKATVFTKKRKLRAPHKMYKCEFCPYESKQQGIIVAHTRIHTGEKPFKCQYCPYKSAWVYALKNHEERHVERGDKREIHQTPAQPELPQELSPVVPNKLLDEQSVKNRKRFKDRLFNYRSYRSARIQNDESSHTTRKKQFDCKICGAMFDQLSSLLNHREVHYIY